MYLSIHTQWRKTNRAIDMDGLSKKTTVEPAEMSGLPLSSKRKKKQPKQELLVLIDESKK